MKSNSILVGVTEWHGVMHEATLRPPDGISFTNAREIKKSQLWPIRSPIKGYLRKIDSNGVDVIEALISPILTTGSWIYSLAHYAEALAFNVYGMSIPRQLRAVYIRQILARDNCKRIIFWSNAAFDTLANYGRETNGLLKKKSTVIYPGVRRPSNLSNIMQARFSGQSRETSLLFGGDFFRKGGAHVVDAFERAQRIVPNIRLRLCCDERLDFNTSDIALRSNYLRRIKENPGITLGRVARQEMIDSVLPTSDIYVLPTYAEAFGFALLEAMAYGIPVISTNHFAIPEIVSDNINGLLINVSQYDCNKMFPGYFVRKIPHDFHEFMSESVFNKIMELLDSGRRRSDMGLAGIEISQSKFSLEHRNELMREVYEDSVLRP